MAGAKGVPLGPPYRHFSGKEFLVSPIPKYIGDTYAQTNLATSACFCLVHNARELSARNAEQNRIYRSAHYLIAVTRVLLTPMIRKLSGTIPAGIAQGTGIYKKNNLSFPTSRNVISG